MDKLLLSYSCWRSFSCSCQDCWAKQLTAKTKAAQQQVLMNPPQPLHINNCQYHRVEHCFFCAVDNSLKWYCLARKINQRVMGEQARFKSMSSSCFHLTSASVPSCPVRKVSAAARQKMLEYPHRC